MRIINAFDSKIIGDYMGSDAGEQVIMKAVKNHRRSVGRAKTRSQQRAGQMQFELDRFIALLQQRNVTRYLEIGARYGDTFYDVMRALPKGSTGVCVDLPGNVWGSAGTLPYLKQACEDLRVLGYDITLIIGDSTDSDVIERIREHEHFDAALLDGDHRYQGIKTDFENYSPLCGMVALHDIVGEGQRHAKGVDVEVPRFWQEIKDHNCDAAIEYIAPNSKMGIGIWQMM